MIGWVGPLTSVNFLVIPHCTMHWNKSPSSEIIHTTPPVFVDHLFLLLCHVPLDCSLRSVVITITITIRSNCGSIHSDSVARTRLSQLHMQWAARPFQRSFLDLLDMHRTLLMPLSGVSSLTILCFLDVKWGEVMWSEVMLGEVKWIGVKWGQVNWRYVRWRY